MDIQDSTLAAGNMKTIENKPLLSEPWPHLLPLTPRSLNLLPLPSENSYLTGPVVVAVTQSPMGVKWGSLVDTLTINNDFCFRFQYQGSLLGALLVDIPITV